MSIPVGKKVGKKRRINYLALHDIVHEGGQTAQRRPLHLGRHQPPPDKLERLERVPPRAHRRPEDLEPGRDEVQRVNGKRAMGRRNAHAHERPKGRQHLERRLVRGAHARTHNRRRDPAAAAAAFLLSLSLSWSAGQPLHLGAHVGAARHVHVVLGALGEGIRALVGARIDGDDAVAHGLAKRHHEGAHAAPAARHGDPLARDQVHAALERLVRRHAAAQDGRHQRVVVIAIFAVIINNTRLGQTQQKARRHQRVLRKRPIGVLARVRFARAARLAVLAQLGAVGAGAAKVAVPGDADALAGGNGGIDMGDVGAQGLDAADALVAENRARRAQVAGGLAAVGAAEGGEVQADEDLVGTWDGLGERLDLDGGGVALFLGERKGDMCY